MTTEIRLLAAMAQSTAGHLGLSGSNGRSSSRRRIQPTCQIDTTIRVSEAAGVGAEEVEEVTSLKVATYRTSGNFTTRCILIPLK